MTREPRGEYLLTPFEYGEDKPWLSLPTRLTDEAKAKVLARFLEDGRWGGNHDEAAIFPHVMAQDIERAFRAIDKQCLYFVLTVGNEQLEAEGQRRQKSRIAVEKFRISSTECFERFEKEGLA